MVKKSRGGQTLNSSAENQKSLKPKKLKKKKLGAILIEVAFTLPVVVYLMFFCIELIKINITKEALQSICEEATYLTIAHDFESYTNWEDKIDAIIEKYRPSFIPQKAPGYSSQLFPVIRYRIHLYATLDDMLSMPHYGGTSVVYQTYGGAEGHLNDDKQKHFEWPDPGADFIPTNNMQCGGQKWGVAQPWMKGTLTPNNYVFVITFTCNYPFSSGMVKMLFGGGVNTKITTHTSGYTGVADGAKGRMYILWARGSGIINPK